MQKVSQILFPSSSLSSKKALIILSYMLGIFLTLGGVACHDKQKKTYHYYSPYSKENTYIYTLESDESDERSLTLKGSCDHPGYSDYPGLGNDYLEAFHAGMSSGFINLCNQYLAVPGVKNPQFLIQVAINNGIYEVSYRVSFERDPKDSVQYIREVFRVGSLYVNNNAGDNAQAAVDQISSQIQMAYSDLKKRKELYRKIKKAGYDLNKVSYSFSENFAYGSQKVIGLREDQGVVYNSNGRKAKP